MKVYQPGTKISINGIDAHIEQVLITISSTVLYKCVWWDGRNRKEDFIHESEFTIKSGPPMKEIGFK